MRQCTLVALYRQTKPKALVSLIHECYDLIKKTLLSHFSPYEIPQIHATIVGLEGLLGSSIYNLNINKYRDAQTPMDILQLIDFLRTSGVLPFQIQIGGFVDRDYPFTSRGERPYERSFSIQGDKAVIMGWPICGEPSRIRQPTPIQLLQESRLYPDSLDRIRRAALSFGVMHAYHRQPTDRDNDFYLRIGLLDSSAPAGRKAVVAQEIRTYLSTIDPIIVEITAHDIYIVSYESGKDTLPVQSTKIWSLAEVSQKDLVAFFVEEPSSSTRGSLPPERVKDGPENSGDIGGGPSQRGPEAGSQGEVKSGKDASPKFAATRFIEEVTHFSNGRSPRPKESQLPPSKTVTSLEEVDGNEEWKKLLRAIGEGKEPRVERKASH